ncbi:hypothetical protein [Clostridium fermenticellae]|uniref:hypothetical protein n=1 Tax=Clostridium fermenticellae TaxID=2068654 RepID=UPI0018F88726|nr:hypothetical protein [Clostridium fermenticellae]
MNPNKNIFFKRFDGAVRKIFFEDKSKYIVLSWIIFRTNYQEEYQGLKRNECYFSYSVVENECNVSRWKLQKILLELEAENFIVWIHKSKAKYTQSIIYLIENEQYSKQHSKQYGKSVENNSIEDNCNMVNNTVDNTSSRNISKNKSNIYTTIFEYWNSKKIITHKKITKDMENAIDKALKTYSDKEIRQAIGTYSQVLKSDFYFNYKWSLKDFLNRKNGISTFMDEGTNKCNYDEYLKHKQLKEKNKSNVNNECRPNAGAFQEIK